MRQQQTHNSTVVKISAEIADRIRAEYIPRGVTMRTLAARYGLVVSNIFLIIHGVRWQS